MIVEELRDAHQRMERTLAVVTRELGSVRTGRANISILDSVTVDYYGTQTPLNQLATMSAPEPNLIVIQPYDRNAFAAIEKAILQSDLGLNPNSDGTVVRLPIPELTEDRRKELARHVGKLAEEGKTAIRQIRRDANEHIKKLEADKEISQDDEHRAHQQIQEITDSFCAKIDELAEAKRDELMEI
jgi:ribosome recycling factor